MNVSTDDLLKVIGRQQIEILALQAQVAQAAAAVKRAEAEASRLRDEPKTAAETPPG